VAATAGGAFALQSHASGGPGSRAFVTGPFLFISSVVIPLGVLRGKRYRDTEKERCRQRLAGLLGTERYQDDRTLKGSQEIKFKEPQAFSSSLRSSSHVFLCESRAAARSLLTLASGAAVAKMACRATTAKRSPSRCSGHRREVVLSGFRKDVSRVRSDGIEPDETYYYEATIECNCLLEARAVAGIGDHETSGT